MLNIQYAVLALIRAGKLLEAAAPVPSARQQTNYTCGAASVLSVVKYYGLDSLTEDYLAEQMGSSPEYGTDINAMAKMFDTLGLETKSGEMTLDQLKEYTAKGIPVIVALQAWGDNGVDVSKSWEDGHYSVVMSVGDTEITLRDPVLKDAVKNMPIDEFTACWHDKDAEGTKLYSWGMAVTKPSHTYTAQLLLAKKMLAAAKMLTAVSDDTKKTGVMIALVIPEDIGKQIAIEGGEPPKDMHITLAYIGKIDKDVDSECITKLKAILSSIAAQTPPLKGILGGYGRFSGPDADVFHATVDVPGLNEFRAKIVEAIKATPDLSMKDDHGFSPHCTIKYMEDKKEPNPEIRLKPIKITFDSVILKAGMSETEFAFEG